MGRFAAIGVPSFGMVSLEVPGWKSGRTHATVLVLLRFEGREYLVSMLGESAAWVRNVRAAGGAAVLRHGAAHPVLLVEVPTAERPPILRAYLEVAPGGRPHIPVDRNASVSAFEPVAAEYPVFRVEPRP
ncbi:MAG: nitroreductase family deazaflavin-dependent oxidoreductase [Dehalococcoidia bacterium]|nr:nitroreductase family deazaflavin-dependent oxidoreductase [Dehalococcoidia bacterium]